MIRVKPSRGYSPLLLRLTIPTPDVIPTTRTSRVVADMLRRLVSPATASARGALLYPCKGQMPHHGTGGRHRAVRQHVPRYISTGCAWAWSSRTSDVGQTRWRPALATTAKSPGSANAGSRQLVLLRHRPHCRQLPRSIRTDTSPHPFLPCCQSPGTPLQLGDGGNDAIAPRPGSPSAASPHRAVLPILSARRAGFAGKASEHLVRIAGLFDTYETSAD